MIRQLRVKLIAAAMLSLGVVLLVILGGVNLMSYAKVVDDADRILAILDDNGGAFPRREPQATAESAGADAPRRTGGFFDHDGRDRPLSPETPYESRFFSVLVDETGAVLQTDTVQIAAIDDETAAQYGLTVWQSGRQTGFLQDYRYLCCAQGADTRVIFLDCTRGLSNFRTTLAASVVLAAGGLLAVLGLLVLLSGRMIRPVAESYEKQKRFITDAGHELKTPLTIISADADLAEMDCGENPWIEDIRQQTRRLTGLTNDLICLSRMEESPRLTKIEFPLSDVVEEMAQSFAAPARQQGKDLTIEVQPMLAFTGDEKSIRQLVSLLLDNALKYAPSVGWITLRLEKQNRTAVLTVGNATALPVEKESLRHLFDRFYRADPARTASGYGLGLSIARSIVAAHKGRIRARTDDGNQLWMTVTLPLN